MNTEALHLRHSNSGIFVRCMLDALELLRNPRAWVFVLPQAAMSAALLAGLLQFHRSPGKMRCITRDSFASCRSFSRCWRS